MIGRRIIVTGAARGIGRAILERFLAGGDHVVAVDVLDVPPDLTDKPVTYCRVDLAEPAAIREFAGSTLDDHAPVDVLVNNAATGFESIDLVDMPLGHWDRVQNTNLRGAALLSQLLVRGMVARHRGVIVSVASCAAFAPESGHTAYGASKAGLVAFTRCLAREVGRSGVRVVCVVPGWIGTETNLPDDAGRAWIERNVSLGRHGEPEEIAEVVWFLASDQASYISGQAAIVDGGMI